MPPSSRAVWIAILAGVLATGCGEGNSQPPQTRGNGGETPTTKAADGLSPEQALAFLKAHQAGLGHMERYEYADAAKAFRRALELAPASDPARINLAIALLNDTGARAEAAKSGRGAAPAQSNFDEALGLLDAILERDPNNLHAHYCRGLILEYQGQIARAHEDFVAVTERDPTDGHAWAKRGATLTEADGDVPNRPAGPKDAAKLIAIYEKSLACDPYLSSAWYRLQQVYGWAGKKDEQAEAIKLFQRLDRDKHPANPGEGTKSSAYGEVGKYARLIDPMPPNSNRPEPALAPRFDVPQPLKVDLPEGHRWAKEADFAGKLEVVGRARARFGAAVAHFDADGDGKADLYLAGAVVGPDGVRDALLINKGEGRFEDATYARGLRSGRASLGVAAGDFDADGKIDLVLTGVGDNRLYRNLGDRFEDVTAILGDAGPAAVSPTARLLDLDQDGDLDLIVVNYCSAGDAARAFTDESSTGLPNVAYRNDGQPPLESGQTEVSRSPAATAPAGAPAAGGLSLKLTRWTAPEAAALGGGDAPHTGIAALDLDADRDLDLVFTADGAAPVAAINDRLGRFRAQTLDDLKPREPQAGVLAVDFDKDGRTDLVMVGPRGRATAWRNARPAREQAGERPGFAFAYWPTDARLWRAALAADVDLDGWTDLVGLPSLDEAIAPAWARNEGGRLAASPLPLGPEATAPLQGLALVDVLGDALPDLILLRDGAGPRLALNKGNGNHWLALELSGRWMPGPMGGPMRTNPHGLGTRILLQGPGLDVAFDLTTPDATPAQSVGPVVLGLGELGRSDVVSLVRLSWPDGVMQCELNQPPDQVRALAEYSRKTGSCPVLFTWDGTRMVCLGDFLGGGGLGYLVAPGEYGQPDRDEAMAIAPDQLKADGGTFRLAVVEPMDEAAYLDKQTLDVIDRPPGVKTAPEERFAPGGNRPTGALIAWSEEVAPERALDLSGRDVSAALRAFDRRTVDTFRRRAGWIGYAEEHGIVLDFGDRLARFGPADRLVLALAGWVEYPYSQTNYAAASAGVALKPPVLERLRDDGTWGTIEPDPGYPAGLPRLTTLDLTGKLTGPRCVLRLRTNMELYWDQAFVAVATEGQGGARVTSLPVGRATLGYRGYLREVAPDGRPPLLYDYAQPDPAPLARLAGRLTRYGDVTPLLAADDDQLCILGPGDEVKLEFAAAGLPALPEGWTRAFVLRSVGYCKDVDPFTAASDTIEPVPWRGMPAYPFGREGERPQDEPYGAYLRTYQTRQVRP